MVMFEYDGRKVWARFENETTQDLSERPFDNGIMNLHHAQNWIQKKLLWIDNCTTDKPHWNYKIWCYDDEGVEQHLQSNEYEG